MSDLEFPVSDELDPEEENAEAEGEETFDDAFSSMESEMSTLPQGDFVILRNGANAPRYVPLYEGETGVAVAQAIARAGLTVGVVEYYLDNGRVNADTFIPKGAALEIIGNIKGGSVI